MFFRGGQEMAEDARPPFNPGEFSNNICMYLLVCIDKHTMLLYNAAKK